MKNRKNARGFTLVELSIVMALVAILAVMIVSFTSLTSLRTKQASAKSDCMDAFSAYRTAVVDGFASIDTNTAFAVSVEGGVLEIGEKTFALPEKIDSVAFAINTDGDSNLLRITVTNTDLSLTESFTIASHCGATFAEGGGNDA